MKKQVITIPLLLSLFLVGGMPLSAQADEKEVLAKEVTTLFRSARSVISKNQGLINDAAKGDKGLSGAAVVAKAKENFKAAMGADLPDKPALTSLIAAITQVMQTAQPLINEQGKGFKGFLPAVFAKQMADAFNSKASGYNIKLTAPKDYIRNLANRPDTWESSIIEDKFKSATWKKGQHVAVAGTHKGKAGYRFILPEYYGQSCLKCHGGPKGALDITGGKKEGGKLGELGGAISFVIYD